MSEDAPKLHIDSDWKAQAQAEKERLAEKTAEKTAAKAAHEHGGAQGEMPPADFRTLVATLASQAMMGLGAYGDPQTGRAIVDVVGAQFAIDLLGVLEEKTKGNLTDEESAELKEVLAHLRARFVQIARLVAAQMQRDMGGAGAATDAGVAGSIGLGAPPVGGPRPSGGGMKSPGGLVIPD